jgi:hypothetical protein
MEIHMSLNTLFIYVDESGNFDFKPSGTKHFVMSMFVTSNPLQSLLSLGRVKYNLLARGISVSNFHASDDRQSVRDQVFREISPLVDVSARTFWIKKIDENRSDSNAVDLYELFGVAIARAALVELRHREAKTLVVVFDKALKHREEQAFLSKAKTIFSRMNYPFHIYFHSVSKDFNGQIADYVAWANYVALERNEFRPVASLPSNLSLVSEIKSKP